MQQQLQQYFVLHTYFQAYGEKIPISEITLLLKNHQIWQYFKKGCQIGRQVVVENEAEVNRRKQTTTTSILDCSTYLETLIIHFSLDFLWQEGLSLHNGPILHQFKIHIITMQYILHITPFISYKGVVFYTFWEEGLENNLQMFTWLVG